MKTKYSKTRTGDIITIEINNDCFEQFQTLNFTEAEITRWAEKYSQYAKDCSHTEGNEDGNYKVFDFEEYYDNYFDNDLKDFVAYFFGGNRIEL